MIPKETLSLLRRLQTGVGKWPVDSSRKGRDLGEFLRTTYQKQFQNQLKSNVSFIHSVCVCVCVCVLRAAVFV